MPRRFIKRYLPEPQWVREHKHLQFLGDRLHDPNLWHLNRRSVAGAVALGIFTAFLPIAGQMLAAALGAMWLRINLPLAVATVWITNPFTFAPIFYFNYRVGAWMLSVPPKTFEPQLSAQWLIHETRDILLPLSLGSIAVGGVLSILSYALVRLLWRYHIIHKRRLRGKTRLRRDIIK